MAQREPGQGRNGGRGGGGGGRRVGGYEGEGAQVKNEGGIDNGEMHGEKGGEGGRELLNGGRC